MIVVCNPTSFTAVDLIILKLVNLILLVFLLFSFIKILIANLVKAILRDHSY